MKKNSYLISEQQFEDLISMVMGNQLGVPLNTNQFDLSKIKSNKDFEDFLKKITDKDESSQTTTSTTSSNFSFNDMVEKIIDNFEGGYYDPMTMKSAAMGNSGETMYGMDAKASDMLKTSLGRQFWDIIHEDKKKNPSCWKLEYDPAKAKGKCYNPSLAKKLKDLIAQIMKPDFDSYSNRFLSEESKKIVNSHPGLLFNFVYCVWNGPGYFQDFSKVLNEKVKSGIKDPKKLSRIMLDFRKNYSLRSSFANNLIKRGGRNMEDVIGNIS